LPPGDESSIKFVDQAVERQPNLPAHLLGDLNVDLLDLRDRRAANNAELVAPLGLFDFLGHFRMRKGCGNQATWHQGAIVLSFNNFPWAICREVKRHGNRCVVERSASARPILP
jgi:hypothetical protein